MKFDIRDVEVRYYDPNERANGWRLDPNIAVHLIHRPSGIEQRCSLFFEKARNFDSALIKLMKKVVEYQAPGAVDPNTDIDTLISYVDAGKVIPCAVWNRAIANGLSMRNEVLEEAAKIVEDLAGNGLDVHGIAAKIREFKLK